MAISFADPREDEVCVFCRKKAERVLLHDEMRTPMCRMHHDGFIEGLVDLRDSDKPPGRP